jgi:hypothetical protein
VVRVGTVHWSLSQMCTGVGIDKKTPGDLIEVGPSACVAGSRAKGTFAATPASRCAFGSTGSEG